MFGCCCICCKVDRSHYRKIINEDDEINMVWSEGVIVYQRKSVCINHSKSLTLRDSLVESDNLYFLLGKTSFTSNDTISY